MTVDVYSFSGTGNSLAMARAVAAGVNGQQRPINGASLKGEVAINGDALGIVFPVYHSGLPLIVTRFVERLTGLAGRYIFGVGTCGDTAGLALQKLSQLIEARGGHLDAGFAVQMPYNYITPPSKLRGFFDSYTLRETPPNERRALLAAAEERVARIAAAVCARQSIPVDSNAHFLTRLADRLHLEESLGRWAWLRVAGVRERTELSFLESRQLMDHAFGADEACIGCGTCARICPVGNIEIVDERPAWRHRCEQCFACLQWCPQEAIQFRGNTTGQQRYHHPDVTLADMVRQAGASSNSDSADSASATNPQRSR